MPQQKKPLPDQGRDLRIPPDSTFEPGSRGATLRNAGEGPSSLLDLLQPLLDVAQSGLFMPSSAVGGPLLKRAAMPLARRAMRRAAPAANRAARGVDPESMISPELLDKLAAKLLGRR